MSKGTLASSNKENINNTRQSRDTPRNKQEIQSNKYSKLRLSALISQAEILEQVRRDNC
jgi:hypothetical protein